MNILRKGCFAFMVATSLGFLPTAFGGALSTAHAATEVAVIVDGNAITNYDIQRRTAFLRLQQRKATPQIAREELIDEMLKRVEIKRRNMTVPDAEVNQAFAGFAQRNKMTPQQLTQMLSQTGVTAEHFKTFIGTQIGWQRLIQARWQAEHGGKSGMISIEETVKRIKAQGGVKPQANEYELQQVIFVIPANKRGALTGKRMQEANAFRNAFQGCATLKTQAKGKIDVTVRTLGRILEQQLPPEWEKSIVATPAGRMTAPQKTERGVEALAVCSIRKVSDDRVAQLVFSLEDSKGDGEQKALDLDKKYLAELKAKARIQTP